MRFLVPVGGVTEGVFGVLTSYKHKGVPSGIIAGLPWAGDNCAFTGFDAARFTEWLQRMTPYRATCLFVVAPDAVGDSQATMALWHEWQPQLTLTGGASWSLAFVAQDGQEPEQIPLTCDVVFIGGSTEFKLGRSAIACIQWAQAHGKAIHIGRINWGKRYHYFRIMKGSETWTTDGTRMRFDGREKTLRAWTTYQNTPPLLQLD